MDLDVGLSAQRQRFFQEFSVQRGCVVFGGLGTDPRAPDPGSKHDSLFEVVPEERVARGCGEGDGFLWHRRDCAARDVIRMSHLDVGDAGFDSGGSPDARRKLGVARRVAGIGPASSSRCGRKGSTMLPG